MTANPGLTQRGWVAFSATAWATVVTTLAVAALSASACTKSVGRRDESPPAAASAALGKDPTRSETINHLMPARDSVGKVPTRFEWTAIQGAESYSLGIWNEVDRIVWRQDHIATNSVMRPDDGLLEPGTYFWTVSAVRDGQQVGESGLAAFVVRPNP